MYLRSFKILVGFNIFDSPPTNFGIKFGRALYTPYIIRYYLRNLKTFF